MSEYEDKSPFYRQYDLAEARRVPETREPAPHQMQALESLHHWHGSASDHDDHTGGILVLPTGAGKTFTAVHFLCSHPLSEGVKVLWLAHTHHLLEQALQAFHKGIARVTGRGIEQINIRVVSGATGHFRPANIAPSDDVLICSLQTATRACAKSHPALMAFLDAAGDELFVVFDEAHHAPATTYRKLNRAHTAALPAREAAGDDGHAHLFRRTEAGLAEAAVSAGDRGPGRRQHADGERRAGPAEAGGRADVHRAGVR